MVRRKQHHTQETTRIALVFCVFIVSLLAISVLLRVAAVVAKSRFDGAHRFTLAFHANKSDVVDIVSFAPERNEIVSLRLLGWGGEQENIGKVLGLPIDGTVNTSFPISSEDATTILWQTILSYQTVRTDTTFLDLARLLLFVRAVPLGNVTRKEVHRSLSELAFDKLSASLFGNATVIEERQSISIINGANIPGLGQRLARFVANMGGNVVSVTTGKQEASMSAVACREKKTYTCAKLRQLLGFGFMGGSQETIADITITIGQDSVKRQLPF